MGTIWIFLAKFGREQDFINFYQTIFPLNPHFYCFLNFIYKRHNVNILKSYLHKNLGFRLYQP